jgi:hypothetical protein
MHRFLCHQQSCPTGSRISEQALLHQQAERTVRTTSAAIKVIVGTGKDRVPTFPLTTETPP